MPSFGVIGDPISQSLSPRLHRMVYEATGFDGDYSRFLVKQNEIANVIPAMKALGISGINVTSPHKQAIMPFLDEISPEAREIGAVNTVKLLENGRTIGYNTDCAGFAQSLDYAGIAITGKRFAVCGISGAGRAVCYALRENGADEVIAVSTDPEKGMPYSELDKLSGMDAIINCTPLGMAARIGESPVKPRQLHAFGAAVDLIYNPAETQFLKAARESGLKTLNGLPMLVFQGLRAFELWTGISPNREDACKIINRLACFLSEKRV